MKKQLLLLPLAIFSMQVFAAGIPVYPESGGRNLRIPMIAPVDGGAKGKCLPFEDVTFTYPLAPLLDRSESGKLELSLRDNLRRNAKTLFALKGPNGALLALRVQEAWKGRGVSLDLLQGQRIVKSLRLPVKLDQNWKTVSLSWNEKQVQWNAGGKNDTLPLPAPFVPEKLQLSAWHTDEVELTLKSGTVKIDWEKDYAAILTPEKENKGAVHAQLHGFDSMVISDSPEKRDYPSVVLMNSSNAPKTVTLDFSIQTELGKIRKAWKQSVTVPAHSGMTEAVRFPFALKTDVCHLKVKAGNLLDQYKHFMYVERRQEKAGDKKFGLHDVNGNTFGFWPDALPIDYAHKYLRWGYVQGPAWVKDRNHGKEFGVDPATPPEEWAWNTNLDWELLSGRTMFVCLQCSPWHDWQRGRDYPVMHKHPWGRTGGMPNLRLAAKFIKAAAERYNGKIFLWEMENEPNTNRAYGSHPEDYAELAKMVYAELKKVNPANTVFGISGTSNFTAWMKPVFAAGGGKSMDGVSWHTYSNPAPDQRGLIEMLEKAKDIAKDKKRFFNSETGHMCVMRENVTEALPKSYVDSKVAERAPGFVSRAAWPGRVYDEISAGCGMVRNAVINFREGAKGFVYFGWNLDWPNGKKNWKKSNPDFAVFSITPDGIRTPNLYTLSLGVLAAQLEGAGLEGIVPVEQLSLRGAVFPKTDGGKVAVVWPLIPSAAILAATDSPELEIVGLLGETGFSRMRKKNNGGKYIHSIKLDGRPVYLHVPPGKSLDFPPPPVEKASAGPGAGETMTVTLSLINTTGKEGEFTIISNTKGSVPQNRKLTIPAKSRASAEFTVPAKSGEKGWAEFSIRMPDGNTCGHQVEIISRPRIAIAKLPENFAGTTWDALVKYLKEYRMDKVEQVVLGAPPKLASLQEKTFWGGPEELSASVLTGYNAKGLFLGIKVKDDAARPAAQWPGISGSVIELFFDFRRPGAGLGKNIYSRGAWQFLVQPGAEPKIWSPQASDPAGKGVRVFSTPLEKNYSCVIFIPWSFARIRPEPGMAFGFDVGINAPWEKKNERKTQIMLFGTVNNARDASGFGTAVLSGAAR